AGPFEVLERFRGDDQIIDWTLIKFWEKIRVISLGLVALAFKKGFQDGLIAATVIQDSADARTVVCDHVDFLLEHMDVAFVIKAVFMFQITFDFLFLGDEK
ncbi:MAG: hypothetical protein OEZ27_05935, partial [Nitrospinota bacterium]|nr:hypothetical protein [Nitrospinota bacterium]